MVTLLDTAPGMGHNSNNILQSLQFRTDELVDAGKQWAEMGELTSPDHAAGLADFLAQELEYRKKVDSTGKAERDPFTAKAKEIKAAYDKVTAPLAPVQAVCSEMSLRWLQALEREAAEERRRLEQEAAAAEAAAVMAQEAADDAMGADSIDAGIEALDAAEKAAEAHAAVDNQPKAQVHGNITPKAQSLRKTWHAKVTNFEDAVLYYYEHPDIRAVVEKLASAEARASKGSAKIPGVEFFQKAKAV